MERLHKNSHDNQPAGSLLNEISITDILDLDELQKLQDAFARSNSIAATITDTHGKPITKPSNHCQVCKIVRSTPKGFDNCVFSGKALGRLSSRRGNPIYRKCYSVGFLDASAPIVIDGIHVANWLIGQNCVGNVDETRIISYAREIGADKGKMLQAFREMTKISEKEFKEKLDFLSIMTNQLSNIAYQKLKKSLLVETLKKSKIQLEVYKNNLEYLLEKKTSEVRELSGLLPVCSHCKKIRDDKGYWNQLEAYIEEHSGADVSHGICPECAQKYYPGMGLYDD